MMTATEPGDPPASTVLPLEPRTTCVDPPSYLSCPALTLENDDGLTFAWLP